MIYKELIINAATAVATSVAVSALRYKEKTFIFYGDNDMTGTAVVEGSYDGTHYVNLTTIAQSGKFVVNDVYVYLRARVSAISAGTAFVALMMID